MEGIKKSIPPIIRNISLFPSERFPGTHEIIQCPRYLPDEDLLAHSFISLAVGSYMTLGENYCTVRRDTETHLPESGR